MKKHKFNIFPEAKQEDFERLRDDIRANGFDSSFPIIIFEGDILDGWNRYKACQELGVKPAIEHFHGSNDQAIALMMRTNKRRNLNSGQWACIAAEAEDIMQAIREQVEAERRAKQAQNAVNQYTEPSGKKLPQPKSPDSTKTAAKAAELFNTNRTYVSQATKIKEQAPEIFEKVKAGRMTMQDARKEVARKPTEPEWLTDEIQRKKSVMQGETVVANFQRDKHLIEWASKNGKLVAVDRSSKWGNPFVMGPDGNRDDVCDKFERHYAPHKLSFAKDIDLLKGKVLACHCYPERCHGNHLADMANNH